MELRTLAYFVAVADAGTVSAAAQRVHVAQPSLSRQLRGLEHSLGVDLFERSPGRLALSAAGRALLPRARALLADAEALRTTARLQARGRLEQVTIAAPPTTLNDVVSPFVTTLVLTDPVPTLVELLDAAAPQALADGADLIIVDGRPAPPLASRPLLPLPVWAYLPPGHRWNELGDGAQVELADLLEEELVVLPTTRPARRLLDAALLAAGLVPHHVLEASSGTVAQALCATGRGIAVVSDDQRFGLSRVAVRAPAGAPSERLSLQLHCAWDPKHPAAATLEALAGRIGDWVQARYTPRPLPLLPAAPDPSGC